MSDSRLQPASIGFDDCLAAIRSGWRLYRQTLLPSIAYTSMAVLVGLLLMVGVGWIGISPMSLPLAGGFMLIAPAMLSGFFEVASAGTSPQSIRISTPFLAFLNTPLQVWMVALFCAFIFIIWITDAGVLYSFTIGSDSSHALLPWSLAADSGILKFWFWGSLMGAVLALIIFCISAFSVPILFHQRGTLVEAVNASVKAVFKNLFACISWAVIMSLTIIISTMLLPLLLATLPVLAYASFYLYQRVFPESE